MSLLDSFDGRSDAMIDPAMMVQPVDGFPDTVVVTYSRAKLDAFLEHWPHDVVSEINTACARVPIYRTAGDEPIGYMLSLIGGAAAAAMLEELIAKGGRKFLYFGSCGVLDEAILAGHLAIPTHAYRDEGTSYHYVPVADYVAVPTAGRLANILDEMDVPYHLTRTWTTDAIYRETRANMAKRVAEGCGVVEMEVASTAAVGQFRDVEFAQFLYGADSLAGDAWDPRTLIEEAHHPHETMVRLALDIARRLY